MMTLKLKLYMALVMAVVAALTVTAARLYYAGKRSAQNEITEQNVQAGQNAGDAAMSRRDCVERGGVYQFDTGKCSGATAVSQ